MAVEAIQSARLAPLKSEGPEQQGGGNFAAELTRYIQGVNGDQVEAARKIEGLAVGSEGSIHDAMVAINNAEGSFRLLMEFRNRLIDGVNRLLQTQS